MSRRGHGSRGRVVGFERALLDLAALSSSVESWHRPDESTMASQSCCTRLHRDRCGGMGCVMSILPRDALCLYIRLILDKTKGNQCQQSQSDTEVHHGRISSRIALSAL